MTPFSFPWMKTERKTFSPWILRRAGQLPHSISGMKMVMLSASSQLTRSIRAWGSSVYILQDSVSSTSVWISFFLAGSARLFNWVRPESREQSVKLVNCKCRRYRFFSLGRNEKSCDRMTFEEMVQRTSPYLLCWIDLAMTPKKLTDIGQLRRIKRLADKDFPVPHSEYTKQKLAPIQDILQSRTGDSPSSAPGDRNRCRGCCCRPPGHPLGRRPATTGVTSAHIRSRCRSCTPFRHPVSRPVLQ